LCTCRGYKCYKWTMYIVTILLGMTALAAFALSLFLYKNYPEVMPRNVDRFLLATAVLNLVINAAGFRGAYKSDDIHEVRGRNYVLFIYFWVLIAGVIVQCFLAGATTDGSALLQSCSTASPDDSCNDQIRVADWAHSRPKDWINFQNSNNCCGLDHNDSLANDLTVIDGFCRLHPGVAIGCRHEFMFLVYYLCIGATILSFFLLFFQVMVCWAAVCLFSCKFDHITVEGYDQQGQEYKLLGHRFTGLAPL